MKEVKEVKKVKKTTEKKSSKPANTKKSTSTKKVTTKKTNSTKKNPKIVPAVTVAENINTNTELKEKHSKLFATNIFSPHRKQFDDTKEKRIILLISFCIFLCVLIGLMCSLYLAIIYSTMPLRNEIGISKEEIESIKESSVSSSDSVLILESEVKKLEKQIEAEKEKQATYDSQDAMKTALAKKRDELKTDFEDVKKMIADSNTKILSLEKKIKDLEALIAKNN